MKVAVLAALSVLIVTAPTAKGSEHRHTSQATITCDNDGHCTTLDAFRERPNLPNKQRQARLSKEASKDWVHPPAVDANGNTMGLIISSKTGARARVGAAYSLRFQAYINDLENNYGARVLFMGGIRPGRCSIYSEHPCGKALDVCQLRRGVVDSRCHLPNRTTLAKVAASHGLFEGGRWCDSDYGHAQVGVTAPACGDNHTRIVQQ
jgi:hypothetical protein